MEKHINFVHKGFENYPCHSCGHSFATILRLKRHIKGVHEKYRPFSCNMCNMSFFDKSHLKNHVTSRHTDTKNFKCYFCDHAWKDKRSHKTHIESVHEVFMKAKEIKGIQNFNKHYSMQINCKRQDRKPQTIGNVLNPINACKKLCKKKKMADIPIIQKTKKPTRENIKTNSNASKIGKSVNKSNTFIENPCKNLYKNTESKDIPIATKIRKSPRETNNIVSKTWKLENENNAIVEIAYHIPVDAIFEDLHKLEKKHTKGIN